MMAGLPATARARRSPAAIAAAAPANSQLGRRTADRSFLALCLGITSLTVVILAVLLITIWNDGHGRLSWDFLTNFASRKPANA